MSQIIQEIKIFALAQDPVYIGTGGYTIGRVDNTIVRDPITNVPKIPGSSLAGTWRYYVALKLFSHFKNGFRMNLQDRNGKNIDELFDNPTDWMKFDGNKYAKIKCAGQDDTPNKTLEDAKNENVGHCGHCIVCKGFGFSKKDVSWQGMIFFSDLNILFFPVFTIKGTKWITTCSRLEEVGISETSPSDKKIKTKDGNEGHLNLGWLHLEVEGSIDEGCLKNLKIVDFSLTPQDIVVVPEELFSHIVNSNLEVRTSVSIDPITGASKEGALFTTEAIPRGTIFYGNIRIFDKEAFQGIDKKIEPLPTVNCLKCALQDSKHFYETLGIGGMTTRGFGRLKIELKEGSNDICKKTQESSTGG